MSSSPSSKQIILITGANTGLGLEVVKALCQSSLHEYLILLGGRSLDKANSAVNQVHADFPQTKSTVVAVQIDIEDDLSIQRLVDHVTNTYGRLDILLNNAGAQVDPLFYAGKMTMREMWNQSWSVNTTSTQVLTYNLVPLLLKSSQPRLVFITSGTSTLTEHGNVAIKVNEAPAKGWPKQTMFIPAYRSSKTGMNMMMAEWARILKEDGVKVSCISPGMLATGLGGNQEANKAAGAIDPAIGGKFVKDVIEGARDDDCGKVVRAAGVQPW